MLTNAALNSIRDHFKTHIDHFEYVSNGTVYKAKIRDAQISNGKIIISALLNQPSSGSVIISSVRLYGTDGNLWADKAENIQRAATSQGVRYQFTFTVTEEEIV